MIISGVLKLILLDQILKILFSIFSENLIAVEMNKVEVNYDKPIYYAGVAILDIAKTVMYDFYYEFLINSIV